MITIHLWSFLFGAVSMFVFLTLVGLVSKAVK